VRLLKNGSILNLSEIANSEVAWFKDPKMFSENGITQQKSSKGELKELVHFYIHGRGSETEMAVSVRSIVSRGLGDRGRFHFGEVTARLAPNADGILGDWILR
jgi:hypothetical protein